jgi:hypothetical protein
METEDNKLNKLLGRQPFSVPEGYFEHFTEDFMSRLPEKQTTEAKIIPFFERMKPLLYLAAMFAGAVILLNIFNYNKKDNTAGSNGISVVSSTGDATGSGDDAEFLEYIEEMYADKFALSYIDDLDNW